MDRGEMGDVSKILFVFMNFLVLRVQGRKFAISFTTTTTYFNVETKKCLNPLLKRNNIAKSTKS